MDYYNDYRSCRDCDYLERQLSKTEDKLADALNENRDLKIQIRELERELNILESRVKE